MPTHVQNIPQGSLETAQRGRGGWPSVWGFFQNFCPESILFCYIHTCGRRQIARLSTASGAQGPGAGLEIEAELKAPGPKPETGAMVPSHQTHICLASPPDPKLNPFLAQKLKASLFSDAPWIWTPT